MQTQRVGKGKESYWMKIDYKGINMPSQRVTTKERERKQLDKD